MQSENYVTSGLDKGNFNGTINGHRRSWNIMLTQFYIPRPVSDS